MIAKKISCVAAAVLSLIFAANAPPMTALGAVQSCELYLPVSVSDPDGDIPAGTIFTVKLTAEDGSPVPAQTEFSTDVEGEYSFGPIIFNEPGNYEYTVSELTYADDKIIFDESVYNIYVAVIYNDKGELTAGYSAKKTGRLEKPESVNFLNGYKFSPSDDSSQSESSSQSDSSSWGDSSSDSDSDSSQSGVPNTGGVVALAFSGIMLPMLLISIFVRRRDEKQGDPPTDRGDDYWRK